MTTRISQQQLESYLWGAATLLRGTIDAGDYKQFIFPLLFFKRLCDVFDEETRIALAESAGDAEFAAFPENHRFQIPPETHWREVRQVATNVGPALQGAMRAIETANRDKLFGIFGDAPWTNKDRLSDAMLRELVEHFSSLDLSIANLPEDELGNGYEYLIKKFADDSGHTAAEFYTNRTVVHLMTELLEPQPGESIYDPTCGSGGMLLSAVAHLRRHNREWRNVRLYGQERNLMTSSIARMNCFLHGIEDFRIERGDTLGEPKLVQGDGRLMQFDVVLANPPYSIKQWDRAKFAGDPWGRNQFGTPPQGRADYAFWQHIQASVLPSPVSGGGAGGGGRCAILFPHGVLFRQEEAEMRRRMIDADVIEAVIGLGPNLFYNSPMEACVVICRAGKPKARVGKILFINAVNEVTRERAQSFLTDEHIERIVKAYHNFSEEAGFAHVAGLDAMRANGGNLSIPLYVPAHATARQTAEPRERYDAGALQGALREWLEARRRAAEALQTILPDLPLPALGEQFEVLAGATLFDKSNWQRVTFGEVVRMMKEQTDPVADGVERYVAGEHMETENVHIRKWGNVGDGYLGPAFIRRFRKGQVLYGSRRTYLKKVAVAEWDGVTANTTFVLEAVEGKLLQELLPWLMLSERFTRHSIQESKGSTNPYINFPDIAKFAFDLPPLDQQRRLVELLWTAEHLGECFYQSKESVLALRQAAHDEVFVRGLTNGQVKNNENSLPKNWQSSTVGTSCLIENQLRKPLNADERAKMKGAYPYYGPTGILDYINEYRLDGKYVLIGEDGDHFLKHHIWDMTFLVSGKFNVNNHAHVLQGRDGCTTEWVYQYFKHRDITPFLSRQGAGRLKLQKAVLEQIPIHIPPLNEQVAIIKFLDDIDHCLDAHVQLLAVAKRLIKELVNSLLQD
jgi:type I restriction enzyme M protein